MSKMMFWWGASLFCCVWVSSSLRVYAGLFRWWGMEPYVMDIATVYAAFIGMMVIGIGMKVFSKTD